MVVGKILVIDDEKNVRDVIRLHLEQAGFHILEAGNGEEGISLLKEENNMVNVGVILCDIRMPKVNGIEMIDYLRQEAPGIPIAVITGYPDTELAVSLLKKGVKDYLVKPIEKEKLLETVERLVAAGKDFEY
ncbi:MAG: response regulator [Nitrospinae bacterium]|nr:response regulator [Nitrospinota bacterium]